MATIYRLLLGVYFLGIRIAALFQEKARLFINGRKKGLATIQGRLSTDMRPRIWMHCASFGEFEQGRPLAEAIKGQYPQFAIIITFFSPSGYEALKDYKGADYVFYLPMDSNRNAIGFLDAVKPALCIFIKYELWYFYLLNISKREIPAILVSAVFNKQQVFFKWYGKLHRKMLGCFSHIFVQDSASKGLLGQIKTGNVTVNGDTRFDRVIKVARQYRELSVATEFSKDHKMLVAGSTWKEDEQFLYKSFLMLPEDWKMILVPHEVKPEHINDIEKLFEGNTVLWSKWIGEMDKRVLVVDAMGLLSQLYRYGNVAWIGGGFGSAGVHNVLEAAVYGIPVFFGPVFQQFIEAKELIYIAGANTVKDPKEFVAAVLGLSDKNKYAEISRVAKEYVFSGGGATDRIMSYLLPILSKGL